MAGTFEELRAVAGALEGAGVVFALCGGLARVMRGERESTDDIDLVVAPEQFGRALAALCALGYEMPGRPHLARRGDAVIQRLAVGDGSRPTVDVLVLTGTLGHVLASATSMKAWEVAVPVVSKTADEELSRVWRE
jgi:hypothetical protein